MRTFRYDTGKKWFKGNTHIHSTASDGGKDFVELADMYAKEGYDFLFRTDHWKASDVKNDDTEYPLLWCNGIELDGKGGAENFYHVICLGKFDGISREMEFLPAMESVRKQGGIMILAHPFWSGNTEADALRYDFHGVEIYNHVCHWLNGKSDGRVYWEAMLKNNSDMLAFSADDAHIRDPHLGWNGGWIMINADELSEKSILESIRSGNYYSTQGPEFQSIEFDGAKIKIKTSPVQYIRLVGNANFGNRVGGFTSAEVTEAEFELPENMPFLFIELEDANGKCAWTNNLFVKS